MNICIIGAGNSGCAHAFKFTEFGHSVRLVKTSHSMHDEYFEHIFKNNEIAAVDHTRGSLETKQHIALMTRNIEAGIQGADMVIVMTQSLQHDALAPLIGRYLKGDQVLMLIPGNLGSLIFAQYVNPDVSIVEGESTPFDARIESDMKIHILFKNVRNAISCFPSRRLDETNELVSQLMDTYGYTRKNVIESGLHNPNLVVHTIGCIMSAARIEAMQGEFWMYRESFSPAVWNIVSKLDDEKNEVLSQFDCDKLNYLDACKFRNEKDLNVDALSVFQAYAKNGGPQGPATLKTRFLYEDVPNGLCLLSSLAKHIGVSTPLCDSLVNLASCLTQTDYWQLARTPEKLGISQLNREELISYIDTGVKPVM